ncbi:hypothetical protein C8R46DRAFT_1194768 [Mycena filopes]|nr:hypothetical protein C8R46DRAFT_1194768 [Mycena filopes]
MMERPNTPFFVAFHFNNGGMEHYILPLTMLSSAGVDSTPQWDRLARAGGRMTLHTVRLGHGSKWSTTMVPLRATSSRFHDGLVRIAHDMNRVHYSHQDAVARVRHLIAETDKDASYREIH